MITWFINRLLDQLEPRLEKLVRAAVDEAVSTAADEIRATVTGAVDGLDDIPKRIVDSLSDLLPKLRWPL
ncbi:hypothetical protein [Mycobacterium marinum]|uniref:hypothetical protein n=1 Tax=Mycobacterium marinum TaxID=1781 RepID=UPI000B96C0D6|nr:hypothetical protein [Mycobacterium marinum]